MHSHNSGGVFGDFEKFVQNQITRRTAVMEV